MYRSVLNRARLKALGQLSNPDGSFASAIGKRCRRTARAEDLCRAMEFDDKRREMRGKNRGAIHLFIPAGGWYGESKIDGQVKSASLGGGTPSFNHHTRNNPGLAFSNPTQPKTRRLKKLRRTLPDPIGCSSEKAKFPSVLEDQLRSRDSTALQIRSAVRFGPPGYLGCDAHALPVNKQPLADPIRRAPKA